ESFQPDAFAVPSFPDEISSRRITERALADLMSRLTRDYLKEPVGSFRLAIPNHGVFPSMGTAIGANTVPLAARTSPVTPAETHRYMQSGPIPETKRLALRGVVQR